MSTVTSTRRRNPLTGEFILVSPIRMTRPWSQEADSVEEDPLPEYDPTCNLCPGNTRSKGSVNPQYAGIYVFQNDYPSFVKSPTDNTFPAESDLFFEAEETGDCEVICYSPKHNLNFTNLPVQSIVEVISAWQDKYRELSANKAIQHIQFFETRGKEVGNSAPHSHCQIWSQKSIPSLPLKIYQNQEKYFTKHNSKLLRDYVLEEVALKKRIVATVGDFVLLVPFWAEWPFETLIIPKVNISSLAELSTSQSRDLAELLSITTKMYASLFKRPLNGAPYMMSISQKPTSGYSSSALQLFFRFICPMLTPTRLKYQAGYEKSAEPQRDITPEQAADQLFHIIH